MRTPARLIRKLFMDRSANAVVFTALSMLSLVGGAGLATDTIQWTLTKRQLQRMADSAALAGAYSKAKNSTLSASQTNTLCANDNPYDAAACAAKIAANNELARYNNLVTLSQSPTYLVTSNGSRINGYDNALQATLQSSRALPFSSMFMRSTPTLQATATAAAVGFGVYCVVSLENTSTTGITIQGSSDVELGCGMATNSQGTNALSAGGSAKLLASPLAAVGNIPSSSVFQSGTVLQPYSIPQPDPYASLTVPTLSSCNKTINNQPKENTTVQNNGNGVACYSNINIQGNITFAPGVYIVDGSSGGGITINSGAVVSGTGVVFILTTSSSDKSTVANITINGGAQVNLAAPDATTCSGTACNYTGMLFYQDQSATLKTNANKINGNSLSSFDGAFYFAGQELQFSGASGMTTHCIQLVARQVTFTGNTAINNKCEVPGDPQAINGLKIRLVD